MTLRFSSIRYSISRTTIIKHIQIADGVVDASYWDAPCAAAFIVWLNSSFASDLGSNSANSKRSFMKSLTRVLNPSFILSSISIFDKSSLNLLPWKAVIIRNSFFSFPMFKVFIEYSIDSTASKLKYCKIELTFDKCSFILCLFYTFNTSFNDSKVLIALNLQIDSWCHTLYSWKCRTKRRSRVRYQVRRTTECWFNQGWKSKPLLYIKCIGYINCAM